MDKKANKKDVIVPIIIPSYEPTESLLELLNQPELKNEIIVVINDGSDERYDVIFDKCNKLENCTVIRHAVNLGKGRALKNGFNYVLNEYPNAVGVITADSDGQHSAKSILKCKNALLKNPHALIMGCRDFDRDDIPWKSVYGNKITRKICSFLCGISVSDTQTGLRGIPTDFMKILLNVPGERFEYETNMLIETRNKFEIREVPIETIYDSKENHATHFDTVKDSIRIYSIFAKIFLKYIFSSLSSAVVDIVLFVLFSSIFINVNKIYYAAISTIFARIISASYNFTINYKLVFSSEKNKKQSIVKYFLLAIIQMILSATFVTIGIQLISFAPDVVVKIIVDGILFFLSYFVQRKYLF